LDASVGTQRQSLGSEWVGSLSCGASGGPRRRTPLFAAAKRARGVWWRPAHTCRWVRVLCGAVWGRGSCVRGAWERVDVCQRPGVGVNTAWWRPGRGKVGEREGAPAARWRGALAAQWRGRRGGGGWVLRFWFAIWGRGVRTAAAWSMNAVFQS
jgi:hypothetical protein